MDKRCRIHCNLYSIIKWIFVAIRYFEIYIFIEKQEFMSISLWSYDAMEPMVGVGVGVIAFDRILIARALRYVSIAQYFAFAFYTVFIFLTLIAPLRRFRMRKRFVFNHFGHFIWTLKHSWLSFMVHRERERAIKLFTVSTIISALTRSHCCVQFTQTDEITFIAFSVLILKTSKHIFL